MIRDALERCPWPSLVLGWLWCSPATALAWATSGRRLGSLGQGVIALEMGRLWRSVVRRDAHAVTVGACVLYRLADYATSERLRRHERAHAAQWYALGPLFPLAYAIASVCAVASGKDAYRGNWFEARARRCEEDRARVKT